VLLLNRVVIGGSWFGIWIWWTLLQLVNTRHRSLSHGLVFSVTISTALHGNVFQQWTFVWSRGHVPAYWHPSHTNPILCLLPSQDSPNRSRIFFTTDSQSVSQSVSQCLGVEHPCGTCDRILLPVGMFLFESCVLVSVERPLWREDGSTICSAITQWSESHRTRNHTWLSHLRLPNLEGQVPVFISPRNRVAQLYPRALDSLYVASCDSQGYGVGILTLRHTGGPDPRMYIPQEQDRPVQSHGQKSKSRYERRPVNQYVLGPSPRGFRGAPTNLNPTSGGVH
jgi:hypothetical protein